MGSINKRGDRWRAQVRKQGVHEHKTFATKSQAMQWVLDRERSIDAGYRGAERTLHQMLDRYADEVTPTKRGARWEALRIGLIKRHLKDKPLRLVTTDDLVRYRDKRIKSIKGESFIREFGVLTAAWETARREWKWCESNPCRDVKKPPRSPGRDRIITDAERDAMLDALGWCGRLWLKKHEVALAFLLGLETGMRAGEILGIRPEHIKGDHVILPMTKNGRARAVPLSPRAQELLAMAPDGFTITSAQLDALFRKYKPEGMDYTFHDSRATAITRLSKILGILELARMVGHSDTKMLLRYYRESASDIAKRLAAPA